MVKLPRSSVPISKTMYEPMYARVEKGEEQYPITFFPCAQDQWRIYYMDLDIGTFYKNWSVTQGEVFGSYAQGMDFLKGKGWLPL